VIELVAITDHPGPPLPGRLPLHAVPADGLAAVCAPAEREGAAVDALWRREEMIEALMADRDLLPVRYGTRVEDDAAAARAVNERRDDLAAALERVRGAVELSLRVIAADDPGDARRRDRSGGPPRSGADYIRAKARLVARHDASVRTLHEPLSTLARASVTSPPRPPAELLRAAYLVDRSGVSSFTALVARAQRRSPGLRLLLTGPWPPYSFAER
jgi:hypothetical protein